VEQDNMAHGQSHQALDLQKFVENPVTHHIRKFHLRAAQARGMGATIPGAEGWHNDGIDWLYQRSV
jgi:hypothetical protein